MVVVESLINGDIAVVVPTIATIFITFFFSRKWGTLRRNAFEADILISAEAASAGCGIPFLVNNAVAVVVLIVAGGVDGNAGFKWNTLDLLTGDTGRLCLTRAKSTAA